MNKENLRDALKMLLDNGESELVCIHFPEGAYASEKGGSPMFMPAHELPQEFVKSTVGAGDAFCAGMLYGIHDGWDLERTMRFANAMGAACLGDTTTSGGMKSYGETLRFMDETPLRKSIM